VWLDLPTILLGLSGQNQVTRPTGRQLKCKDPRIVHKYNTYLKHAIQEHHLVEKIQLVYQTRGMPLTVNQLKRYNAIDQQYAEAKVAAERQCRKFHAGKTPWMPSLTQLIYCVLYWKGICKCIKGGRIATNFL